MKRGISGKTRRGSPPMARQRAALRVVQATLLGVALYLGWLAVEAWNAFQSPPAAPALEPGSGVGLGQVAVLAAGAILFFGLAVAMGLRAVRGPVPPEA